jgi:hypothetical protein
VQGALPEQSSAPAFVAPDFWQLYHAGKLPEHGFLMGFDPSTGAAITADWRQLYSALVGGSSGSGKSTLIRNILAQSALQGGRFVVLDPHYSAGEESLGASLAPLRPLMLTDIAASEAQMLDALAYVRSVAEARLSGRDKDRTPIVLVIDETTGLLMRSNVADALVTVLGVITQESRKAGVYAFAIGQQWSSQVLSTTVRNSFVSAISCRTRRDVARVMSGSTEFAKLAEAITIGQAAWMKPDGDIVTLSVPNCTDKHIDLVARTLTRGDGERRTVYALPQVVESGSQPGSPSGSHDEFLGAAELLGEPLREPVRIDPVVDGARMARVRLMLADKKGINEIIRDVWNVQGKGKGWTAAHAELVDMIARIASG